MEINGVPGAGRAALAQCRTPAAKITGRITEAFVGRQGRRISAVGHGVAPKESSHAGPQTRRRLGGDETAALCC